ncbi:RecQ family ATP-dependent DNA helicase [Amphibacillus sp. MSJ-3]|uniref:RecQ family ATP-dependent DNA helicase n=1 Tax=Amphibacillus sp. MSJ-3 TaxID=2841505 RepID=UPI001C0ED360|nr:RecQ family ATP-dependent DNA helicase [Amphibacillus sp. MSJ-3]MBU5594248.1 RecQ family ATP-dependent DNA helicase [Amphibacillus sp. MSJ-3]
MDKLETALQKYFDYDSFRLGQREIIEDILAKKHVFATLPTGSGKSLCYQLPAYMLDGVVLVVTPLLSLMEDQIRQLKKRGFKQVVAINSFKTASERALIFNDLSTYKLIYLSPEMLQKKIIKQKLSQLTIALFVIDEAHCISQWGHEFRPDYLKLNEIIDQLGQPTVLALTATATSDVQQDIVNHFDTIQFNKHIYPVDRDNIAFMVQNVNNRVDKDKFLIDLFTKLTVPTIIYFSSKKESERVALLLSEKFNQLSIAFYHGDLDTNERLLIQEQFIEDQINIICSTSAFGMGVDKQNVRLVIHYHLPTQIESFIQEVGRAGRDQLESVSIALIAPGDKQLPLKLILNELPPVDILELITTHMNQTNQEWIQIVPSMITDIWGLNETQWRFIKNFFEETGILIDEDKINIKKITPMLRRDFIRKVEERNRYKLRKLNELFEWIDTKDCRREQLFKDFQTSVRSAKYHCCDRCGFEVEQWSPESVVRKQTASSWSDQLKSVLLPFKVGGIDNG